jgi:hypothetical protein
MKRQSRPFVVEVKRTRKSPTNIWGSSSILQEAATPPQQVERDRPNLDGIFKAPAKVLAEQPGEPLAGPRILPSLLAEAVPADADREETLPSPAPRRRGRRPAERQPESLTDLWRPHRSEPDRDLLVERSPGVPAETAAAESDPVAHRALAEDLFAGLRPVVEETSPPPAPAFKAEPRRRRPSQSRARRTETPSLPLDDASATLQEVAFEPKSEQALGESAPRREVRLRRLKGKDDLPRGQRWKRRLPSSLR